VAQCVWVAGAVGERRRVHRVVRAGDAAADRAAAERQCGGRRGGVAAGEAGTCNRRESSSAMSIVTFAPKPQAETRLVTVDFIGRVPPGDSIASCTTWVEMHGGIDFTPQAILQGPPAFSGTEVSQMVTSGVVGNIYRLAFDATTTGGQTLQMSGFLVVVPDIIGAVVPPVYLPTEF
jgi:hypothetical protein